MIDVTKQKLINAISFFVKNTKNCKKVKLFKLLYFLDFIHFKRYGTTVTGQDYYAWPLGPVPKNLNDLIFNEKIKSDIKDCFIINKEIYENDPEKYSFNIRSRCPIDLDVFTPKEISLLEEIAFIFKDATAEEMTKITHMPDDPWDRTMKEKGPNSIIDYELAVDSETTLSIYEIRERYSLEKELRNITE